MVILYKDPRGEFIFNRGMSQMQITNTGMSLNDTEREKLRDLEVHCRDIENRLSKYEVNIVQLVAVPNWANSVLGTATTCSITAQSLGL